MQGRFASRLSYGARPTEKEHPACQTSFPALSSQARPPSSPEARPASARASSSVSWRRARTAWPPTSTRRPSPLKEEFAAYDDKLAIARVDVSDRDAVEGMVDRAVDTFGQMDIIVNNAGIMDNLLPIAEMDDDVWERLMKVNLNSVMYGTRKAVRYFLDRGEGGVIINTASLSGLCAGRGGCAYTASKFAVVGLTKNVAFMYADTGIRCNAICPGNTQTNIGVGMRQPSERGMAKATTGYAGATRSGTPEEISAAALFLASDQAGFINGETLTIDGGWSAY